MIFSRSFAQYTKDLSSSIYEPVSREEERKLLVQMGSGSSIALDTLIRAHLRFVVYLLRDFKIPSHIDYMDVIQEGNMGLLYALTKYNSELFNCRIATYAQYWIRFYMAKAIGLYEKNNIIQEMSEDFDIDNLVISPEEEETVHKDILQYLKSFLNSKEVKIISLLFGLEYPFKSLTLREVGLMFHIDAERVRQIKEGILERIKQKQDQIDILR